MGLFGEKEKCCICQAKDGKKQILDGRVCWDCIHLAGPFLKNKSSLGYKQNSKQDFYEAITKSLENEQKLQEFHETDNLINPNSSRYLEYGDYLKIDDHHKWWYTAHGKPGSVVFKRIMDLRQITEKEARKLIKKTDRERASYHNYYTKVKWGHPSNYHMVLNIGKLGMENAVDLITYYVDR